MLKKLKCRVKILLFFFMLCGLYHVNCLIKIQVVENMSWSTRAVNQRSDSLALYQQRGEILDCCGRLLTGREHHTCIAIFPAFLMDDEKKLIFSMTGNQHFNYQSLSPVLISNPSKDLLNLSVTNKFPGVTICTVPLRYGNKPLAHHLLGYIHPGSGQGLAGLEDVYQEFLSSDTRVKLVLMVDAHHHLIPGLEWRYQEVSRGKLQKNLVLTIDLTLQQKLEEIMEEKKITKGVILLLEVGTGKVLALASRPAFDPYHPQKSLHDPNKPLVNRALQAYPPGSLFKLVLSAVALETGTITSGTTFYDSGFIDLGGTCYYCSTAPQNGHGLLTFTQALAYSCHPVFIKVMQMVESAKILSVAKALGLGMQTSLGLPEESAGFLPSSIEAENYVVFALGEQGILVSPLQVAGALQAIASGGYYFPPQIVKGLQELNGAWYQQSPPSPGRQVLTSQTAAELRKMLETVVLYGTGTKAQNPHGAAGLTGTVRAGKVSNNGHELYYGWFAGYAPTHAPRLVGVILLEDDLVGGERAAEIFGLLMSRCLNS